MWSLDPARHHHQQILASSVLREHGQIRIAVYGISMLPSLWPGDVLTIRRELGSLAEGEIVLWERDGAFVAHRVARQISVSDRTYLVTRGDSLQHEDEPVPSREILGKVVSVERAGRYLRCVPACSPLLRGCGRLLGWWDRLRSLVLRWHQWRCRHPFEHPFRLASCVTSNPLEID